MHISNEITCKRAYMCGVPATNYNKQEINLNCQPGAQDRDTEDNHLVPNKAYYCKSCIFVIYNKGFSYMKHHMKTYLQVLKLI